MGRPGISAGGLDHLREWMHGYVDPGMLPGMLMMVARGGEIEFLECMGRSDLESGRALAPDAIFRIYSMTKPITSVATMMLFEEGGFELDDPVADYIPCLSQMRVLIPRHSGEPDTEPANQPVSIRHLLTHTAGFSYGFGNTGWLPDLYRRQGVDFDPHDGPLSEVVTRLAALPLAFHPGSRWHYGVSTDVLGYLVEVLSGVRFDRFVEERISDPLSMKDTGFSITADRVDRLAALYGPRPGGGLELLESAAEALKAGPVSTYSGGSGLLSTCSDYFRFLEMLRRGGSWTDIACLRKIPSIS